MTAKTFAIAFELGFDVAESLRNGFFEVNHEIESFIEFLKELWDREEVRDYVIPFSGRKRSWDRWIFEGGLRIKNRISPGTIFNTIVQGSAADVLKAAFSLFWERVMTRPEYRDGIFPLMQVHDEIVLEVREDIALEVACLLKYCMQYPHFKTPIPILADAFVVDRWNEGKDGRRPVFTGEPYHSPIRQKEVEKDGKKVMVDEYEDCYPEINRVLHYLTLETRAWCREVLFPDGKMPKMRIPHTEFVFTEPERN